MNQPLSSLRKLIRLIYPVIIFILFFTLCIPQTSYARLLETKLDIRTRLCGQLLFMTDAKTGSPLLGLKSCTGNELFIFKQHPADLFYYFEFENAKVESGPKVETTEYGYTTKYITGWDGYSQIASCAYCGKSSPSLIITQPSIVIKHTQTPTVTLPPLLTVDRCAIYLYETFMSFVPYSSAVNTMLNIDDFNKMSKCSIDCYRYGDVARAQTCYKDCSDEADIQNTLGIFFDLIKGAKLTDILKIINDIAKSCLDKEGKAACGDAYGLMIQIAKSIASKGLQILFGAFHSPATMILTDLEGRRTGFLEDGTVLQEIPDSYAIFSDEEKFIFMPSIPIKSFTIQGTGDGNILFDIVNSSGEYIQEISFTNVQVTGNTTAELNLDITNPKLMLDLYGDGSITSIRPSEYIVTPIEITTTSPVITSTSFPSPTTENIPISPSARTIPNCCIPIGFIFFIFPWGLIKNKNTKKDA